MDGLKITPEMLRSIAAIDEFKGKWRALGNLAPDRLAALRRMATVASVGSSTRIEGARLSDREVEALLRAPGPARFVSRDEEEVAGYAAAMDLVLASWAAIPPTENHIKQLHRTVLGFSAKDERHRGEYKTVPNHLLATDEAGRPLGVVLETASPFDTPRLMRDLVAWTGDALDDGTLHPLIAVGAFAARFLAIHPFQDGNGRLSRILTTLLLLHCGYAYVAYGSLESVIEENKDAYYLALRRTQTTLQSETPDWEPWLAFFLGALRTQAARLEARIVGERAAADMALPALSEKIVALACERGRVSTGEIAAALAGESRGTIKARLRDLVASGHLRRHGKGRSTWYTVGKGIGA